MQALIGGGGGGVYSYIHVLPDEFLLKLTLMTTDFKRNSPGRTRRYEYSPPPPINALVSPLLTRAVHLEVLKTLELSEFLESLKRFVARRGRPKIIYSDNGATFKAASKWLKQVHKDERLHDFLAIREVQ